MNDCYSTNDDLTRDLLVNYLLVLLTVLAGGSFVATQIRTLEIGWSVRDSIQCTLLLSIIVLAFYRQKISTKHKAIVLVTLMLINGFAGFYTLGVMAGSVFFFPLAAVTVALSYSKRTTFLFVLMLILAIGLVTFGFTSNQIQMTTEANLLLSNHWHWYSYLVEIILICVVSSAIIATYRGFTWRLIAEIKNHRDELIKANRDLQDALEEVKVLQGILPLCSFCKKIRNDEGSWEQVDVYIHKHSEADISHGICPDCAKIHYPEEFKEIQNKHSDG